MKLSSWHSDDLDLVRALLSALSWRDEDSLSPVATMAIHHEIVRRNRDFSAADALRELSRIGEAQKLEGSYWLPCPTHSATDGALIVVVSSEPTESLRRLYGASLFQGDIGRYFKTTSKMPTQIASVSLAEWLGTPVSSTEWLKVYLESAEFSWPIQFDELEVYRHWRAPVGKRWISLAEARKSGQNQVLARTRSHGVRRYVFLRFSQRPKEMFHELPSRFDKARAMCALQQLAGDPIPVALKVEEEAGVIVASSPIVPDEELAFLQCVGHMHASAPTIEAEMPIEARADVYRLFTALGCQVHETTI